jgi:hypothetical protein
MENDLSADVNGAWPPASTVWSQVLQGDEPMWPNIHRTNVRGRARSALLFFGLAATACSSHAANAEFVADNTAGNDAGDDGASTFGSPPSAQSAGDDAGSTGNGSGSAPTGGADNLTQNPTIIPYVAGSTASSRCLPGHYKGSFSGTYASPASYVGVKIPVSGAIDLHLNQASNPEFLSIDNGTLSGVSDYVYPFSATLTGTLDCTTNMFMSKMNGSYKVGQKVYPFYGTLDSGYDPSKESLTPGTWKSAEPMQPSNIGGSGSWSAAYAGP